MTANDRRPVMIVTGAARGIGAAVAVAAGAAGYAVAVNYSRDADGAEAVADTIRRSGGEAIVVQADMGREAGVASLFETVDAAFGAPDVVVCNAGITGPLGRVADLSEATMQSVLAVNVTGLALCCREAVRRMSTARGGRGGSIVTLSSRAAGIGGSGEWVHYAASKAAVDTFTFGLAREVGTEGIRVNGVAPGLIATGLHEASGAPDRIARLGPTVPIGRAGEPEEVADVVLWLASPGARYVTGAIIPVSGGR
jgi:NAD(P)-dependent dehydrogenase (short-subunit alcohol dehydrogenase family)